MILNLASLEFNMDITEGGGTPAWGTEMGQGEGYKFSFEGQNEMLTGLLYNAVPDLDQVTCPLGKGGAQRDDYDFVVAGYFRKVYVNNLLVEGGKFLLLVVKKLFGEHHVGRRTLKYNPRITYRGEDVNDICYKKMAETLGISETASWFIDEIEVKNQDELHFYAYVMDSENALEYKSSSARKKAMLEVINAKRNGLHGEDTSGVSSCTDTIDQIIYYGCPGTGKSREVKERTEGLNEEKVIHFDDGTKNVFRTTFHPDYDYATFVGCYKPVKVGKSLDYRFIPQVFTEAYVTAKKHRYSDVYLIIEEINRGNCAQIFGDLFQLLDRKDGVSEFPITPDTELMKYLRDEACLDDWKELSLPKNFHIYATMNTSDQSLFPMDSAFKRRWDMKYKAINYKEKKADFIIPVMGSDVHWLEYLPKFNEKITAATDSEDKQMGEFFIRRDMTAEEFKNKVMFYLWNDVCKDLYAGKNSPSQFFFRDIYGTPFAFADLFAIPADESVVSDQWKNGDALLASFLHYIMFGPEKKPTDKNTKEQASENNSEGEDN